MLFDKICFGGGGGGGFVCPGKLLISGLGFGVCVGTGFVGKFGLGSLMTKFLLYSYYKDTQHVYVLYYA